MNVLDQPESSQYDVRNFTNLNNVTDIVKYNLLINHFKPDFNYILPVNFLDESNRSLNFHWLTEYPFLVYSISKHTLIQSYVSIITSSALEFQFLFVILNNVSYLILKGPM